jgi:hypothetical protein
MSTSGWTVEIKKCDCRNKFQNAGFTEEDTALVAVNVRIDNSTIIPPCYIGEDVYLILL